MPRGLPKFLKCDNSSIEAWAAHLRWKLQSGLWELKYQPGRDLIADVAMKALPIACVKDLREQMFMGWQPGRVDAVHEEDEGVVAPRATSVPCLWLNRFD